MVPLAVGTNFITVTARDALGNPIMRGISVIRAQLPADAPTLRLVSGDMQMTNVHRRLAEPIVVRVLQGNGAPFGNKLVDIEVTRSDGRLLPVDPSSLASPAVLTNDISLTVHGVMHLQLLTDANGQASAWWALGGDAGCGNNRIRVMSVGVSNTLYFCASAKPAAVHQYLLFAELIGELYRSAADHSQAKVLKKHLAYDVILVDEIGCAQVEPAQVGLFFTLMQKRHKTKSTLLTSNLGFSEWGSFLKNDHLTEALIDRLTETSHVFNMKECVGIRPRRGSDESGHELGAD